MRNKGFTVIELMVVIAILGVLAALAAPTFFSTLQRSAMTSAVNTFLSDIRYARGEAIKRGGAVVMCRSNAPENATPTCNTGSGTNANGWVSGWVIFQDVNNNADFNAGEPLLRVQSRIASINTIVSSNSSSKFEFTATGRMKTASSAASLQFGSQDAANPPSFSNANQRMVCVSIGGRARVVGDGNSSCTTGL